MYLYLSITCTVWVFSVFSMLIFLVLSSWIRSKGCVFMFHWSNIFLHWFRFAALTCLILCFSLFRHAFSNLFKCTPHNGNFIFAWCIIEFPICFYMHFCFYAMNYIFCLYELSQIDILIFFLNTCNILMYQTYLFQKIYETWEIKSLA